MSRRFARSGWPIRSEHIQGGADIVGSATPHQMGAWVELDASVAEECCGLHICTQTVIGLSATNTSMIVELGFGGSGSEVGKVQFCVGGHDIMCPVYLPLHIPKGTRLAGRLQGLQASDVYSPIVTFDFYDSRFGHRGFEAADSIGLNAADSGPTTDELTDNAWDEAVASTTNPYRALTVHPCLNNSTTAAIINVDVGVGAAGSEQVLGTVSVRTNAQEIMRDFGAARFIEADIKAGSRLALRKNSTASLSGHVIGWR